MLPDRVSNPGPLTYESGALPIALHGPEESKSYRLDNMNESYDDDTGIINLFTVNSKPHLECVGGSWGLNVCVCGGGGGGGGLNSALIQYCICSFPVIAPKYFIVFLFNTAQL